jgi:hypothetical protein
MCKSQLTNPQISQQLFETNETKFIIGIVLKYQFNRIFLYQPNETTKILNKLFKIQLSLLPNVCDNQYHM